MQLSLDHLLNILFTPSIAMDIRPQTLLVATDPRPRVLPLDLADVLETFQAHIPADLRPITIFRFPKHCEVWLTQLWRESVSKLLLDKEASRQRIAAHNENAEVHRLVHNIPNLDNNSRAIIVTAIITDTLPDEMAQALKIADFLDNYRKKKT